eukprot:TRINITY_DN3503_c0_g1_i1.p1 TRINITY_DN3503_c0_g1~~TRINITY_DN3503_c0_g1_i1.p1  ORF type:complete len:101 (+),score=36.26 TRINITY_DN3503_c0_g1_i1:285-587(+)
MGPLKGFCSINLKDGDDFGEGEGEGEGRRKKIKGKGRKKRRIFFCVENFLYFGVSFEFSFFSFLSLSCFYHPPILFPRPPFLFLKSKKKETRKTQQQEKN